MADHVKSCCPPWFSKSLRWLGWFLLDQWFIIGIAIVIIISSQVQVPLDKQQLRQNVVTYGAVATIFLITGLNLPTKVLFQNYKRWKLHLFVQVQSFLVTSAIMYGVVSVTASNRYFMDDGLLCGMILLASLPTTLSSNVVMTTQAHGNTALTVVETTLGNFIAPFLTPLIFKMYTLSGAWYTHFFDNTQNDGFGEVYRRVFRQLGFSVYLPIVVGQIVRNVIPNLVDTVLNKYKVKKFGSVCLLLIIWQTFDQAFATGVFDSVPHSNIIFLCFINFAIFVVWLAVCFLTSIPWLSKYDTISVCYTVPAKTPAIGVPLANVVYAGLSLLQESKLQVPMILFQGIQVTASSLLTIFFRKWIRPDEKRMAEKDETLRDSAEAGPETGAGKEGKEEESGSHAGLEETGGESETVSGTFMSRHYGKAADEV